MRNYFNYFTEIEEYFIRKRGKNLTVSPLDWCLIELWKQNEIPLHVVLRGIDRSFEVVQGRNGRSPRTLYYCLPAVQESFEEYSQATLGQSKESGSGENSAERAVLPKTAVLKHLGRLIESLNSLQRPELGAALRRLKGLTEETGKVSKPDLRRLDQELHAVARQVAEVLKSALTHERLQSLREEMIKELRRYKKRLSSEMYASLWSSFEEKKIRQIFQLPEFTLFELER